MDQEMMRYLLRKPMEMERFRQTGKLPAVRMAPATPLRDLIDQVPRQHWGEFSGIRLGLKLGFRTTATFANLHQLHRWLGAGQKLIGHQALPYQSQVLPAVTAVSFTVLLDHTASAESVSHRLINQLTSSDDLSPRVGQADPTHAP